MAKRYYNLEKETKDGLKLASDFGIPFGYSSINTIQSVNNAIMIGKSLNIGYTAEDVVMMSGLPYFYTNFSNTFSFKPIANIGIVNLINPFLNGYVNIFNGRYGVKTDDYRGALKLVNDNNGFIPFNHFGDNTSFTMSFWVLHYSGVGVNNNYFLGADAYQTNGFRSGFGPSRNRYNFWSGESGGNVYLSTPDNSVPTNTPKYISFVFDSSSGFAAIYLNGVLSVSQNNAILKPRTSANAGLALNGTLNSTSVTAHLYNLSIYYRALPAQEIANYYNLSKGRFGL